MAKTLRTIKSKILNIPQTIKKNNGVLINILLIFAFTVPFLILYLLYPQSYEATWKGRTYYLFFAWLIFIELILSWEKIRVNKLNKLKSIRNIAFIILLLLPTAYVVAANYYGLNTAIMDFAVKSNIPRAHEIPLSTEYLIFTLIFVLTLLLAYGREGLIAHSISAIFLGIIGSIYTVDCLYPYGAFAPFQILVPTTASLAANVLNVMGYQVEWKEPYLGVPVLKVWNQKGEAEAGIAWSCSGIDSLLLYSVTILLFLKDSGIPWRRRTIYFIIGAAITYFINIMRIVTIFIIGIDYGVDSTQWWQFHNYYGSLYSIIWIVTYPLIIISTQILWRNIKKVPQFSQPNPV